jgi:hypothetical protein
MGKHIWNNGVTANKEAIKKRLSFKEKNQIKL